MMQPASAGGLMPGLLLAALGCGPNAAPASSFMPLGGDAARVADSAIPASLVAAIARSRGVEPSRALDGLVEDALLAKEATVRGLDQQGSVQWFCTAALARILSERLLQEARRRGLPADDELETIRVIHAVVLRSSALSPSRAREIAVSIQRAVATAKSEDEFDSRARQVPHPDAQVSVERLNGFDASGRSAEGDAYDATFVAAAFGLRARGETGGVVATPFGWHVIRLMERTRPDATDLERRRQELAPAVVEMRVREQLRGLLDGRRIHSVLNVYGGADDLMAKAEAAL
jgi:hypothetical protein